MDESASSPVDGVEKSASDSQEQSQSEDSGSKPLVRQLNVLQQASAICFATLSCIIIYGVECFFFPDMKSSLHFVLFFLPGIVLGLGGLALFLWCYNGNPYKYRKGPDGKYKGRLPDPENEPGSKTVSIQFSLALLMLLQLSVFIASTGGSLYSPFTQLLTTCALMAPIIAKGLWGKVLTPLIAFLFYVLLAYLFDFSFLLPNIDSVNRVKVEITFFALIGSFLTIFHKEVLEGLLKVGYACGAAVKGFLDNISQ